MTLNDLDREKTSHIDRTQEEEIALLKKGMTLLKKENRYLKEQLDWFKRQLFGQRTEKLISGDSEQLELKGFDTLHSTEEQETKTISPHKRRKPNRDGRDKLTLPDDLPKKTIILDLPETQKICSETGKPLIKIGEEISSKLAHKPGSYYIKEIIRPKYAHPTQKEQGIKIAELPDSILPKSKIDESLLAEITVQKFADHLPLYRIAQTMERAQIQISRKTLSQWIVKAGLALEPLYREMLKKILTTKQLFIDETPVRLQAKKKCKQAYLWVIVGGQESPNPPYKIYEFRTSREHKHGLELLKDYQGLLHSDKYGAYEKAAKNQKILWIPCWAHVRRKFFEIPEDTPFKKTILRRIKYLFLFEKVSWSRSPEERTKIRKEKEKPIIDTLTKEIEKKLAEGKILPKTKLGKAIHYFCGLKTHLKTYLDNPYARLSNNVAERAIRPVAIGRKNWLCASRSQTLIRGGDMLYTG